jgi:catechol 2,3-dioxygenase-like lactoylglutathione lyase family enzyme
MIGHGSPHADAYYVGRAMTFQAGLTSRGLIATGYRPIFAGGYRSRLQEVVMAIVLDHTIVPAHDKEASARFFARILGLCFEGPVSHFAPVRVNDTLTLDFDDETEFESHHYAFKVDEAAFDEIFGRVQAEGIAYGSGPYSLEDMKINHRRGGRGFYFRDPNGHVLEVLTA